MLNTPLTPEEETAFLDEQVATLRYALYGEYTDRHQTANFLSLASQTAEMISTNNLTKDELCKMLSPQPGRSTQMLDYVVRVLNKALEETGKTDRVSKGDLLK